MQARTQTENWCGVLQEVALPGTGADPARFMEAAVKFANERCWGSLSCSMMACPRTKCFHRNSPLSEVAMRFSCASFAALMLMHHLGSSEGCYGL